MRVWRRKERKKKEEVWVWKSEKITRFWIGSGTVSEYFRVFQQEGCDTEARMECSFSDSDGCWVRNDGHGLAGIFTYRLHPVGICYGVRLAVTVPIASQLFGLKYYGLIYNILILNLPLGSFLFSGKLASFLYDAQAMKMPGGGNTCVGAHCYRLVFSIMGLACIIGFGLDVLLAFRTKNLYMKIYMSKKLRKVRKEPETMKG
ncbi:protein NUCLEAR FUSION DEFECTIVE 4-like [Tasmannia lanceolata]|uniref:protein NUCLEAR FUSION DEFECTIVE 4-like n=1 Tax=Tasmannia lanceolata TaxID=3420 RepID=UPI0040628DBF